MVAAAFELPDPAPTHIAAALTAHIGTRRVLLVLDNFEHVLEAVTLIPTLLLACPGLCVVVTSRGPLLVIGEHLPASTHAWPGRQHSP